MNLDEINARHERERRDLAARQAEEIDRAQRYFQQECERLARIRVFRVAAALRHGITCAEVTGAQIHEAEARAALFTMPRLPA